MTFPLQTILLAAFSCDHSCVVLLLRKLLVLCRRVKSELTGLALKAHSVCCLFSLISLNMIAILTYSLLLKMCPLPTVALVSMSLGLPPLFLFKFHLICKTKSFSASCEASLLVSFSELWALACHWSDPRSIRVLQHLRWNVSSFLAFSASVECAIIY